MSSKTMTQKLLRFLTDGDYRFLVLAGKGVFARMPAEKFLTRMYRIQMGREPDLCEPKTYTEKLQWLKLHDHDPIYTTMVDKYAAKDFVARKIGAEHVIPLLGVWDRVEDIDFEALPDRFVLKTTHDSGGICICTDKRSLDPAKVRKHLRGFHRRNYYARNREWPYKHVPHRIIAEPYLVDSGTGELRDYKFFTFGGEPKVLYIAQGRGRGEPTVADFFDMDFQHLPFTIDHDTAPVPPEKPACFEEMKRLAAILAQGTPQLRVDFYEADGRVYFGEMTFFHCSGMEAFHPDEWDRIFGDWVTLPEPTEDAP